MRPALRLLFVAVALLLLIAAANVANLLLARAAERTRELAVRCAVGAGRGRLVRQLLAESLLLATFGSLAGLLVAWWTVRGIAALSPDDSQHRRAPRSTARVMIFAIGLTAIVAVIVGIVPAWQSSGGRLLGALRGVAPGSGGGSKHHVRSAIAIAEVALALLLMSGAGPAASQLQSAAADRSGIQPRSRRRAAGLRLGPQYDTREAGGVLPGSPRSDAGAAAGP